MLTVKRAHGLQGVWTLGEVYEREVFELLDALNAAAAVSTCGRRERLLQRLFRCRQHQVTYVQHSNLQQYTRDDYLYRGRFHTEARYTAQ